MSGDGRSWYSSDDGTRPEREPVTPMTLAEYRADLEARAARGELGSFEMGLMEYILHLTDGELSRIVSVELWNEPAVLACSL